MYPAYIVKRTRIYLSEEQDELLEARAHAAGTTKSAVIRRAIDSFLGIEDGEADRLAAFREAVRAAAGIAPYLPPGDEYVEAIRRKIRTDAPRCSGVSTDDGRPRHLGPDRLPARHEGAVAYPRGGSGRADVLGDHPCRGAQRDAFR